MTRKRHFPIFGHGLSSYHCNRDSIAKWCRAVRACDDADYLHSVGINWFTVLGRLPLHGLDGREARSVVSGRLEVIERQQRRIERRAMRAVAAE